MKANNGRERLRLVFLCLIILSVLVCGRAEHFGSSAGDVAFNHRMKGDGFLKSGQYGAALNEFQKAAQLEPNFWPVHGRLAVAYDKMGQTDKAITEYQKVILLKPPLRNPAEVSSIYLHLGQDLYKVGRRDEARTQWQHAVVIAAQDNTRSKQIQQIAHSAKLLLNNTVAVKPS